MKLSELTETERCRAGSGASSPRPSLPISAGGVNFPDNASSEISVTPTGVCSKSGWGEWPGAKAVSAVKCPRSTTTTWPGAPVKCTYGRGSGGERWKVGMKESSGMRQGAYNASTNQRQETFCGVPSAMRNQQYGGGGCGCSMRTTIGSRVRQWLRCTNGKWVRG